MTVIHDEGAPGQTLHDLKTALHRGVGQRGRGLGGRYAERAAYGDGAQCVRRTERAGGHDLDVGTLPGAAADEINAQRHAVAVLRQHHAAVVGLGLDAEADLLALETLAHEIAVWVIDVINHRAGVVFGKQTALGAFVILKIRVLAGADVIFGQIREGHDLKGDTVHAVVAQGLTADFQHAVVYTRVQHFAEQAVQFQALRRRVGGGLVLACNVHAVGTDVGAGQPCLGHDGSGQQGRGGLALRAGNANQVQLIGGVAVEICTDNGQRRAGIVGDDLHSVGRQIQRVLHQKGTAAVLIGAGGVGMTVQPRTHQADEQRTGRRLAGVVDDGGDIHVGCAGVGDMFDKVVEFHEKHPS